MHIHILGICGTFMGGIAALARHAGHKVTGSDKNVYPPMSTQLNALDIELMSGYEPENLQPHPDLVIIGNALSRGNPAVEYVLEQQIPYCSGPRWLGEQFLKGRQVLAVAGTHGKTTTTSMLAWILESAGMDPGFLIGGIATNFPVSARAGSGPFVIEADEYDTAFFDKRAKFVHYRPKIAILNNLEFDHADIYPNLAAIQTQFHHLLRTIPGNGQLIINNTDEALDEVLAKGCWTPSMRFGLYSNQDNPETPIPWQVKLLKPDATHLELLHNGINVGKLEWAMTGTHNALNGLAACAAAHAAGVNTEQILSALSSFKGVKRRLEFLGERNGVHVYDDFAHHPTAIRMTLEGLRRHIGNAPLLVALDPRSNTMQSGLHRNQLVPALALADAIAIKTGPDVQWDPQELSARLSVPARSFTTTKNMLEWLHKQSEKGSYVVFMSNGAFDAAPYKFLKGE